MQLPTFRRKIFRSLLLVVAVFGGLGLFLIAALAVAGSIAPALVHLNYDSIEAADHMREAWNALRFPADFPELPRPAAIAQFDRALAFEEGNVTEPGEQEAADWLSRAWTEVRLTSTRLSLDAFVQMDRELTRVVTLNEEGMFRRVNSAKRLSAMVLAVAGVTLVLTLAIGIYLADTLAKRLAAPIRGIADVLHARPRLDQPLALPTPTTIELRILIREMRRLWASLVAANQVNVAEIIQQKGRLETLLDAVEDGFLVLDAHQTVTHVNGLMERIIGLPLSELIGKPWTDLSTAGESYLLLRELISRAQDQEAEAEIAVGGRRLSFTLRVRQIRGAGGEPLGRLILLHDMTEKRQRDQLRSELVDLLSHELRTPVQSLGMAAEMLARQKAKLSGDQAAYVETINAEVTRIRAVSQQFIQATLARSKALRLDLARVPLASHLREWLQPFSVTAEAKGVRLEFHSDEPEPWARLDPVKFPWAVSNLLSNAVRVSPPGGVVGVRLTTRDGRVVIEVADDGPGIPPDVQRRLDEPSYQGEAGGAAPAERGLLGVGLTVAQEVVEAHEGRLEYAKRPGRGALFRISLPLVDHHDAVGRT